MAILFASYCVYLFKERELCVPNYWSRQQLILELCIQGDFGIDKIFGLLQRTYHWHGMKQVHQFVQQRLQEVNAKYKARVDQYAHGDVSIA